jgi:hypothetical protein
MKRLLSATMFPLVLMVIGTSIAFAGGFQGSSLHVTRQQPAIFGKNIIARFKKVWTDQLRRN